MRLSLLRQVVESHPENPFPDLRILRPPASLRQLVDSQYADLESLPTSAFTHTPWAVLLVKAVDQWSAANGGSLPSTYKQKKEIRSIVENYRRPGVQADQNIDEALSAVNTALNLPAPSGSVKTILSEARGKLSALVAEGHQAPADGGEAAAARQPSSDSAAISRKSQLAFWVMAAAVEQFVSKEGDGLLPLVGTIPDMTSDTTTYVKLQQLYASQAASDVAIVQANVREIAAAEGLSTDLVTPEELKRFCKNAPTLGKFTFTAAESEYPKEKGEGSGDNAIAANLLSKLNDDFDANAKVNASLYLLLRAAQAFHAQSSYWPGAEDGSFDTDLPHLKQCLSEVVKELGLPPPSSGPTSYVTDELLSEFGRWGGAEMHAIASVMGGIASQEAIKAATHQYLPLNNTFVFNGASGTTSTLEL